MDLNNSYKRFKTYQNNDISQNNFKKDYVEQNYKVNDKPLDKKIQLGEKCDLPKQDNSFLKNATRLSVNSQGKFFKK